MKKRKIILISLSSVLLITLIICFIYLSTYSHAISVDQYLKSSDEVTIKEDKNGYFFDGYGTDDLIIFYPGAKVDTKAYSPLMYLLAKNGIDVYLVDMPFHFAIFGINKADYVIKNYSYKNYYGAGHSLGGAMISTYISKNYDLFKGLILLASYTTKDLLNANLDVLSIYGSLDGVLNMDNVKESRNLMPSNYIEYVIEGGNHANFASYGNQKGDNESLISKEEQIDLTLNSICSFIK